MTGDILSLELQEFFAATGARHLAKPFELVELLQELERAAASLFAGFGATGRRRRFKP